MPTFSEWSFARVFIVSIAWVILVVAWQVLQFSLLFRRTRPGSGGTGSGGIGVSVGMFGVVSALFGPPLLLLVVWLFLRYVHRT